ncbi:MAG: dihydrolipoyl dehydrogenase [Candidatus Hydrogenedentes bacterium]|nr:dihydrolipoyl dehydrogenase [Candidatus Hydrogenedentota bacterium]
MSAEVRETQVAVIGAGPGGYGAGFMAADLGLHVTMIDLEPNPGGTCLYRGCIPSKALLHVAKVITDAKEAEAFGITFPPPALDLDKMRATVDKVVRQLTGGLGQLCKARKIEYIQARANFLDSNTLRLIYNSGKEEHLRYEKAILATGSRPTVLEQFLIDSPRVMNSTSALEMPDIPGSMLVIGGGYIGLELGTVYATLGTRVTVAEAGPALLPGADPDMVQPVAQRMGRLLHDILLKTTVVEMKEADDGIEVRFEGEGLERPVQVFDKVLISIGRKPNSSGIGLKSTKVEVDDKGFVVVDEQRHTADPPIYAIGDLVGNPMLAHKATHEGRVAAEVIAGHKAAFKPKAIPAVVFTDPEIAWCGLTEAEAAAQGREVRVAKFPWTASGRATTLQRNEGLTKILADPETDLVLGVGICGESAGELISEGALAIEMGALASDVELTIHPHPTLGETIMESAEIIFGSSTHLYRKRKEKAGTIDD